MAGLNKLFESLNDKIYTRHSYDTIYSSAAEGRIIKLKPKEILEVGRTYPSREHLVIAYFGEDSTRVLYVGEDAGSMRKTVSDLKLPNYWPSNLGEKVFFLFAGHLRDISSGHVSLEQQVRPGKEDQFGFVLSKLIEIYRTSENRAYAAENSTSLGGVSN